jgi:hypothetical protein
VYSGISQHVGILFSVPLFSGQSFYVISGCNNLVATDSKPFRAEGHFGYPSTNRRLDALSQGGWRVGGP